MLDDDDDFYLKERTPAKQWQGINGSVAAKRALLSEQYWAAFKPPVLDWKAPNEAR